MSRSLSPITSMPSLFSGWLRPNGIFDKDIFDLTSGLIPVRSANVPFVNIKETPKEYTLELAAPGMERKDFKVEVENHTLSISSEKEEKTEKKKESNGYVKKEYSYTSFCRSFTLPEDVKEDSIDAKYQNGILTVHVPKAKETKAKAAKQIAVA
jgi:HSP20 family protein